ncbi:ABC-type nitrate/sulfonate/bicarbonate transport system substrate-binding protein [Kordia periserrulae]|uniref:ABC-type nitrate/sulfonate/bicarbonate transport system substrate-binding protein n=1 Tax=Kordia periserrulae TaxID=701523 RepID=A0A2T6BZF1_9FLAO|nr:substrate-binding domain-containing protein [Kordia periserrulae]PTX61439.1 ABC-type nitrate/sulfonate/bicarbonate transport system substrate-binding protein [Kordia periserrulae]
MKKINIGGVPEHFNLAWYLTLKERAYEKEGISLRWKDYPEGTGAMCKALRNEKIDIAVILTEGIIKDIIAGNPSKIVQTFVESPLIWGIHVAADAPYNTIDDLKGTKAAISRFGSGSHLMAYVNAENNGWDTDDLEFEVINNLEGAIDGLNKGKGDYFMWEHFTTKPLVDQGIFKRVADCPTPWPCFVIAVRTELLEKDEETVKTILSIINEMTAKFKDIPNIDEMIASRYEQQLEDVQKWLSLTEWSQEIIDEKTITKVQDKLLSLDIIPQKWKYKDLTHKVT